MIGDEAALPSPDKAAKPRSASAGAGGGAPGSAGELAAELHRSGNPRGLKEVSLPIRLTGEAVSICAMALATLAIGMGLHLHLGFEVWLAMTCAVACYAVMLAGHALMPRYFLVDKVPAPGSIARAPGLPVDGQTVPPSAGVSGGAWPSGPAAHPGSETDTSGKPRPEDKPKAAPAAIGTGRQELRKQDLPVEPAHDTTPAPKGVATPHGSGRSEKPRVIAATPPSAPSRSAPPLMQALPASPPLPPSPRESDVEMIQGLIRKLADEVNSATSSPPKGAAAAAAVSERAISSSVEALKATAGSMRSQDEAARRREAEVGNCSLPEPRSESGRPPEVNARLSSLAEALALGRVEVLLDPIVDFNAGAPRHFELYLRLRDDRGRVLDTGKSRDDFEGTGMLARIDGARLAHASQIAVRFTGRGRNNALFSSVSGEALSANNFLQSVADAYRERRSLAGALIMTFSQADVRGFTQREWNALAEFAGIGFRYCISEVMDLEMDFEDLKARGFDFAKLDAAVFLEGLPAGNDVFIPAKDICKHLAEIGLSVIVGGMKNEETAAKVFGFGALYGQGTLFGGAKAVKREVFSDGGHAVA